MIKKIYHNETTTYTYDDLDRLISVERGGEKTTYTYDAFNRRLTKNNTRYIYQNQNEIGSITNNQITELRILGLGKGAEIGAAIALELNQDIYLPLHDHQGNVTTLLTLSGEIFENYHYTAFGEEENPSSINPWRYSSKRHDPESNFIYFGRRYYAPDLGRWITADPIGFDDGPNLYAYLQHSPLMLFDLYGLAAGDAYRDTKVAVRNINRLDKVLRDRERKKHEGLSHYASKLAHSGVNVISQLTSFHCELRNEILQLNIGNADKIITSRDPYESLHRKVDQLFSTDLAKYYTPEAISMHSEQINIGMLPVTGSLGIFGNNSKDMLNKIPTLDELSKAGKALDRSGLTKAGRALEKHGGRKDSVFPKAKGNIMDKNLMGQNELDDILTHPESIFDVTFRPRYGEILNVIIPGKKGARFKITGEFIMFLEP